MRWIKGLFTILWSFIGATVSVAAECDLYTSEFYLDALSADVGECLTGGDTKRKLDQRDDVGNTPLHLALVNSPDTSVIRVMLVLGADAGALNADGLSPVHAFAASGTVVTHLAALKAAGVDINARSPDDICRIGNCATSPLHRLSVRAGMIELLRAFLAAGADVSLVDPQGRTALHYAARQTGWQAVEALVAAGANINARDYLGFTALHLAGQRGPAEGLPALADPDIVRLLLSYGADPDQRNNADQLPLTLAAAYTDDPEIWRDLFNATDPDELCKEDEKGRTIQAMLDLNENLERDDLYWKLNQMCS